MPSALPRPRQVSIAGWVIIGGSAAVVLTVFQQVAGLHSLDTRDAIERILAEPPFDGMDLTTDDVLGIIKVLSMIAGACATATAILGWHVLQRSRSARIALSILAVPLFITGFGTGAILSTAVAAAILLLWLRPARDWFDGTWKPEEPRPAAEPRQAGPQSAAPQPPSPQHLPQQPPPYAGWPPPQGAPAAAPGQWPPPAPQATPPAPQVGPRPATRPPAVVAAVVLTWVCSLLLGGLFVAGAAWLIASPDTLMDEMTRQNPDLMRDGDVTVGLLRVMVGVMAGAVALWALAVCVLGLLVLRGKSWARVLLLVSTAVAGLGLLLATVLNQAMAVPLVGAASVFALLLRRDVSAWFARRG